MDPDLRLRHVDELRARLRRLEADVIEAICDADALRRLMLTDTETREDVEAYNRVLEALERRAGVQTHQLGHEREYLVGAWASWRTARGWLADVALVLAQLYRGPRRDGS